VTLDHRTPDPHSGFSTATDSPIEYRNLVGANDERARWAEADPTGGLVGPDLRRWAREHRIANSPMQPQMTILRAKQRSYGLLLDSAVRTFGLHAAEVDRMTA
jgi:hypothetical protein